MLLAHLQPTRVIPMADQATDRLAELAREATQERNRLRPIVELIAKLDPKEGLSPLALENLQYMAKRALGGP